MGPFLFIDPSARCSMRSRSAALHLHGGSAARRPLRPIDGTRAGLAEELSSKERPPTPYLSANSLTTGLRIFVVLLYSRRRDDGQLLCGTLAYVVLLTQIDILYIERAAIVFLQLTVCNNFI